jgi:GTP-binding protein Era
MTENHKAGFVSIIGKPNAGKSTLLNALLKEKLSIVTPKAQTTRHRILGILNDDNFQIVFSDTPGIIKPMYKLQQSMMKFVGHSLEDADLLIYVHDATDKSAFDEEIIERIRKLNIPKFFVLNKIDAVDILTQSEQMNLAKGLNIFEEYIYTSALENKNLEILLEKILIKLPIHPAYYPKDDLSDRTERFFAAEIVREKILLMYKQEIPYSCEVIVTKFKEKKDLNSISIDIIVERESQKGILIGKGGESLRRVNELAKKNLEQFFGKKVFLETNVRVIKNWRSDPVQLKKFGYEF